MMEDESSVDQPLKDYESEFRTWVLHAMEEDGVDEVISLDYYQNIFLNSIQDKFGLEMIEDNLAAHAIINLLNNIDYMRICEE